VSSRAQLCAGGVVKSWVEHRRGRSSALNTGSSSRRPSFKSKAKARCRRSNGERHTREPKGILRRRSLSELIEQSDLDLAKSSRIFARRFGHLRLESHAPLLPESISAPDLPKMLHRSDWDYTAILRTPFRASESPFARHRRAIVPLADTWSGVPNTLDLARPPSLRSAKIKPGVMQPPFLIRILLGSHPKHATSRARDHHTSPSSSARSQTAIEPIPNLLWSRNRASMELWLTPFQEERIWTQSYLPKSKTYAR